ncbi:MAG: hypothetical protein JWO06_3929 [Bacteroidota bacterium]|nr:hypothetical protein [Bacteroidota bacterium]
MIEFDFYTAKKSGTPLKFIAQKLFLLKHIWGAEIIFCQFAGYHSFLPALFGKIFSKPVLIIVGGTEAHYFPGIGYGNWQKGLLKTFTAFSLRLCSHIVPKHKTLMFTDYSYDEKEPSPQGIYARLPKLKTPYTEITNGYDADKWICNMEKKKRTFITVATGWEFPFQQQLKGIDLIVEIAPFFPDCEFMILGVPDPKIIITKSSNIKIMPLAKNEDLASIYSKCEFYLQLSMAEGFPNSLCEAMLCKCVPIGSNVFSIPEIIGDSGFILTKRNTEDLTQLIKHAIGSDTLSLGEKARKRIVENYSIRKRRDKLLELCK